MAVTGNQLDAYKILVESMIEPELAQRGSVFRGTVNIAKGMGEKQAFRKLGKATSVQVTNRLQAIDPQEATFEKRLLSYVQFAASQTVDKFDMLSMGGDYGAADMSTAIAEELGRKFDANFVNKLLGTQAIEVAGSATTASLSNTVAVNDHVYHPTAATNDICLTPSKLRQALKLMAEDYVNVTGKKVYVAASSNQLELLRTVGGAEISSRDYRSNAGNIELPGVDLALQGYLGLTFIRYENIPLSSTNEQVIVFTEDAMKGLERQPVDVRVFEDTMTIGNPVVVSAVMDIGLVRMHDEAVVKILCHPTTHVPA